MEAIAPGQVLSASPDPAFWWDVPDEILDDHEVRETAWMQVTDGSLYGPLVKRRDGTMDPRQVLNNLEIAADE